MRHAVVGAGSWGTALATHLARAGHPVRIWAREPEVAAEINGSHTNSLFLPGAELPELLHGTDQLSLAVADAEVVIVAVPSEHCRGLYGRLGGLLPAGTPLVSATKGLEIETLKRMSEIVGEEVPGSPFAVLSGPSFAIEVARQQPTAVVAASLTGRLAETLQRALSTRTFRVYASDDVVGVELGGALKNVIAIAAGIIDGLGYGHNTVAALITRGLAEMSRLGAALGGRPDTLSGLAGLGDLVLTCTGGLSRNRTLGQALARGESVAEATSGRTVAEGVRTTRAACDLAERKGVEMPIAFQMREVLYGGKPPRSAVDELMLRSLKRE
jgi:glycerol-3-phosphate dehydrogenase (NAD(P)+)